MKKKLTVKIISAVFALTLMLTLAVSGETVKFSDIEETAIYKEPVYKLVNNGVLNGYPDGTFRPFATITRAEMCKMINLTFGFTDTEGAAGFIDLVPNEWYIPYVLAGQKAGYVQGDDVGTFRPNDPITREEVCAILCRIIKPYDLGLPVVINDTVSDWAKDYVRIIAQNLIIPLENGNFRATEYMKRYELAVAIAPYSNIKIDIAYCTVYFKNGDNTDTRTVEIGKTLNEFPTVTNAPEGKRFAGWSLANPETEDEFPILDNTYVFYDNQAVYAYAIFEEAQYTVKFTASGQVVKEQTVKYGEIPTAPAYNPEKSGKKFTGWAEEGTTTVLEIASYKVTKDVTFEAVFVSSDTSGESGASGGGGGGGGGGGSGGGTQQTETFTVRFLVDGEEFDKQTVEKSKYPRRPQNPGKDGYKFLHWSKYENGEETDVTLVAVKTNITYYAVFAKLYSVKFMVDGNLLKEYQIQEGQDVRPPKNPDKEEYVFKHWSKTENGKDNSSEFTEIDSDLTFYAVFEKQEIIITRTVKFFAQGKEIATVKVDDGKTVDPPTAPKKEGFSFRYWSETENGSELNLDTYAVKKDVSLYAVYAKNIVYHTVTFYSDGVFYYENRNVVQGTSAVAPPIDPEIEGYTFKYWSLTENGNEVDLNTYAINRDTAFYAVYEKNIVYCSVKFYADGKLFAENDGVEQGTSVSAPSTNPRKEGFEFRYWSTSENGSEVDVSKYKINSDTLFYAVFVKEVVYCSVKFYADGALFYENNTVLKGTAASAPQNEPQKEGHTFRYWSTSENGSEVDVSKYTINSNTSFYAVFEKEVVIINCQVLFYKDGEVIKTETVVQGNKATPPADPHKDNYDFLYWSLDEDGDEVNVPGYTINQDTEFYAVFKHKENPNDPEVINALKKAVQYVSNLKLVDSEEKQVRSIMKQVLNDVIAKSETFLIDKEFVKTQYSSQIASIKSIVKNWDNNKRSQFITKVSNEVDEETMNILMDYFLDGEDISQYL